jgi:hypothetical protein
MVCGVCGVCAEHKRLDIRLDFKRGSKFEVDSVACAAHDTVEKSWRHLNFFQLACYCLIAFALYESIRQSLYWTPLLTRCSEESAKRWIPKKRSVFNIHEHVGEGSQSPHRFSTAVGLIEGPYCILSSHGAELLGRHSPLEPITDQ